MLRTVCPRYIVRALHRRANEFPPCERQSQVWRRCNPSQAPPGAKSVDLPLGEQTMSSVRFVYASRDRFPQHLSVSGLFVGLFLLAMSIQPVALHAGTYSDLHDFNCPTDGCAPSYSGILAQGRDGSIYG